MKKYFKRLIYLFSLVLIIGIIPGVICFAACHNATCGCNERGIGSCSVGMTCWYNDEEGCSGHSWYLYESYPATCTREGRIVYKCSICPGERIFTTPALGHNFSPWTCINNRQHMRICYRCGLTQYDDHHMSDWRSAGDGNYTRNCPECGYSQSKGLYLTVSSTDWTAGDVTVNINGYDEGEGNENISLYRVNCITGIINEVRSFHHNGAKGWTHESYTQTDEGIYNFYAISTDTQGHSIKATTERVHLDHSDPVIIGAENTEKEWTNIAPVISVRSTDHLYGTGVEGSGLKSLTIYDENDIVLRRGDNSTAYTLEERYEGERLWRIEAVDKVGHKTDVYITTRYDITPLGIDGTEITFVTKEGDVISGYCQDNIIDQRIDDDIRRSRHGANKSSGIKSVILYRVKGTKEEPVYSDTTYHRFNAPDTHSAFRVYYDINLTDDAVDYYNLITEDFAGNRTKKKLTSKRTLLTLFHTSIDRGAY